MFFDFRYLGRLLEEFLADSSNNFPISFIRITCNLLNYFPPMFNYLALANIFVNIETVNCLPFKIYEDFFIWLLTHRLIYCEYLCNIPNADETKGMYADSKQ